MYAIDPDGAGGVDPVTVYCDMTGGGWTLAANIYDSAGDDAPNATSYVVSGWQQTANGQWSAVASTVSRDSSGTGSSAVSLAFVAALKASAGQQNLKMCFVSQSGTDSVCRSSSDASLTLVSYSTGNSKLTAYFSNKLAYTYGRLVGLAGSVDGYVPSAYQYGQYKVPRTAGGAYDFGYGGPTAPYNGAMSEIPDSTYGYYGVWTGSGNGKSYRPWFVNGRELSFLFDQDDPVGSPKGFRLYIGP
jgi:hypothetical protein